MNQSADKKAIEDLKCLSGFQKEPSKITAYLFNLIIYTREERRVVYLKEIVLSIVDKFPCRVIFIENHSDSSGDCLKASTTSLNGKGNASISCEQINIHVSDSEIQKVPFVILPLLIPDLPIYLIWGQDPTVDNAILTSLQKYACRLIFDSESTENLQNFSTKILKIIASTRIEIIDTQWATLSGWREVLAQVFDNETKLQHLRHALRLQITYNSHINEIRHHPQVNAIFFQAWIADRLGWEFQSLQQTAEACVLNYKRDGKDIIIALMPEKKPEMMPGRVICFEMQSEEGFNYLIQREESTSVIVHITSDDYCEMPFIIPLKDVVKGTPFMREIFYRPCSSHYKGMLKLVSQIPFKENP